MAENWTPEAWSAFIEPLVTGIRASKTDHHLRVCRCSSCMNSLYYLRPFVDAERPLRANISETLPVVVINEQGEEEKNKDEQEFSWCCLSGRG